MMADSTILVKGGGESYGEVARGRAMNELGNLLEQWANLEPGWCELRVGGSYLVGKITVDGDSVAYRAHPPFTEPHSLMRIQFSVQQAIVARKWSYELMYDATSEEYKCFIRSTRRTGYSPTTALLRAYLQALSEVMQKGQR